jgi:DNA-binding CsgD family transcriptional regulator
MSSVACPRSAAALTHREREVLRRITDGQSTQQIAAGLSITPSTARTHAHNVLLKLGVRSRAQAAALTAPTPRLLPTRTGFRQRHQPDSPPADPLAALTLREREVLACMVGGLSRAEIATRLSLSAHTVRSHARNILAKLGVHSTLEAAALVRRLTAPG